MMEEGRTKVKTVFNFFHQNSDGGEQVYDGSKREETSVFEPMIFIEHQIDEETAIDGHIVFDGWTAASDTKIDDKTGASGGEPIKMQSRIGARFGVRKEVKSLQYGANLGFSSEYDYRSLNASFNVARGFAKDNFTLGLGVQYYLDEVSLFKDLTPAASAKISEGLSRKILATNLTASQILTPKDIIQMGISYIRASGYLESTANSVLVAGIREAEQLPDARSRYALSTQWVHGFGEGQAINLWYRYYSDDWKLDAHTLKASYLFEVNDDEDFVETFIRYYRQTATEHYADSFTSAQTYMTSDSDLEKFNAYELGVYTSTSLSDKKLSFVTLEDWNWSNGLVYSKRSNGLHYIYYQTGIGFEF
jgi:hypothetical protein